MGTVAKTNYYPHLLQNRFDTGFKSLLSEAEMGETFIPAEFFISNFKKMMNKINDEFKSLMEDFSASELRNRLVIKNPILLLQNDPSIIKRKVSFGFKDFIYTFENIPLDEYNKMTDLLNNGNHKEIPSILLPYFKKKLSQQVEISNKIFEKFTRYKALLMSVPDRNNLTERESLKIQMAIKEMIEVL